MKQDECLPAHCLKHSVAKSDTISNVHRILTCGTAMNCRTVPTLQAAKTALFKKGKHHDLAGLQKMADLFRSVARGAAFLKGLKRRKKREYEYDFSFEVSLVTVHQLDKQPIKIAR